MDYEPFQAECSVICFLCKCHANPKQWPSHKNTCKRWVASHEKSFDESLFTDSLKLIGRLSSSGATEVAMWSQWKTFESAKSNRVTCAYSPCIVVIHSMSQLSIILISPLNQTKHFPWLPKPSNQQKSPLMWYALTFSSRDPLCLFKHSWQPGDRALEIALRLIYSIIQSPCQLVTCWPRDSVVSYQTSDWTAAFQALTQLQQVLF